MNRNLTVISLITYSLFSHYVDGANILILMILPAPSHFKSFQPLFEEIIKRGHNVTLVSGHSLNNNNNNIRSNYTRIDISQHFHKLEIVFAEMRKQNRFENLIFCSKQVQKYNEYIIQQPQIQALMKSNDNYDLILSELFFLDIFVAFGYRFDAPVIGLSAQPLLSYYNWIIGNPAMTSYVPNLYLPMTEKMSFIERTLNTVYNILVVIYYEMVSLPTSQTLLEKYFYFGKSKPIPKMKDIMTNISATFVNTHYVFGYPKPYFPNVIETAGIHITPYNPLPKNLQKFMDNASHGVIYFSFGSLIEPNELGQLGNLFIRILKHLPQNVLFKWNPKLLSTIPKNILVQEWIPQMAVLNHPNCKLFITHGGIHSLLESLNSSVPIIGIPFFTDQQHNMRIVEYHKIGITVEIENVEKKLLKAINESLNNPIYQINIKKRNQLFNNRLTSPLETAMYWIEHLIKFKDGSHLKSASLELAWYQYFLLDVMLAIIVIILSIVYVSYLIVKILFKNVKIIKLRQINKKNE